MKTVLIIDNDLGFVFWLGHVLDTAAYSAFPAKGVADATLLLKQFRLTVDVLAINPALTGALEFIAALQHSQKEVRVIGILEDARQVVHSRELNALHCKPEFADETAKVEWLECIERVLCGQSHGELDELCIAGHFERRLLARQRLRPQSSPALLVEGVPGFGLHRNEFAK